MGFDQVLYIASEGPVRKYTWLLQGYYSLMAKLKRSGVHNWELDDRLGALELKLWDARHELQEVEVMRWRNKYSLDTAFRNIPRDQIYASDDGTMVFYNGFNPRDHDDLMDQIGEWEELDGNKYNRLPRGKYYVYTYG